MDPKWTLSLLAAILHTVASAPESVFALEGNSVTLIMQRHNNMDTDDVVWLFNQSCDVIRYYPHHNKLDQLRITDTYKGRVEFDRTTFSLELTNLRKNDSGLYKGEINAEGRKAVSEYRLNVLEQVTAPVLTVESSGDLCNVTVNCRAGDLSLTSTCDISTCTQEEQTAPSSLAIFIKDAVIICNHSNPVSWYHSTIELETLCQSTQHKKHQFPLGDEQTPIWIYITASGLVLLVLGGVLCFLMHSKNQEQEIHPRWIYITAASGLREQLCALWCFFRIHSKDQAGSSSKVYQSVGGIVPTDLSPEKKQSEVVCAKALNPSSDVKRRTPFKSPSSVVVNLLQTPSPFSAVKRRTPFKSISPRSYAVVDLSQTQTPSSVVKSRTPFKSKSQSKAKENLLQTQTPSSVVKRRTSFKSNQVPPFKSQSKAKKNLFRSTSPESSEKSFHHLLQD